MEAATDKLAAATRRLTDRMVFAAARQLAAKKSPSDDEKMVMRSLCDEAERRTPAVAAAVDAWLDTPATERQGRYIDVVVAALSQQVAA